MVLSIALAFGGSEGLAWVGGGRAADDASCVAHGACRRPAGPGCEPASAEPSTPAAPLYSRQGQEKSA